jgi:hypothetical protein
MSPPTVTTRRSRLKTQSCLLRSSGARSLDKAIEVQTEFAKTAYETFVTESQTIGVLYGDLAKQCYKPFGGFASKKTLTN